MSVNNLSQLKNLFNKAGFGVPKMNPYRPVSNQSQPQPQQPVQPKQPQPQPKAKPGCGGCRRKKA